MPLLTDEIGEAAQTEQVPGPKEPRSILEGQPLAGGDLLGQRGDVGAAERPERVHVIAGFVTGWNGVADSGDTSSRKGEM